MWLKLPGIKENKWRNVPAGPLPPEPERFFGRKEVLYLIPLPHPQHLAEGLPEL
jgi:hypothetical protein